MKNYFLLLIFVFGILFNPSILYAKPAKKKAISPPTWSVKKSKNDLDEVKTDYCLTSVNIIQQYSPYINTRAILCIRDYGDRMYDVLVYTLNDSNIIINEGIKVKFGQDEIKYYETEKTASFSSDTFFISESEEFINNLSKASQAKIGFTIFRNGMVVAIFNIPQFPTSIRPKEKILSNIIQEVPNITSPVIKCESTDTLPIPTRNFNYENAYPSKAIEAKIEGDATIKVQVDSSGRAFEAIIINTSDPIFNSPSLIREAKSMRYKPARSNCENVAGEVTFNVKFVLP